MSDSSSSSVKKYGSRLSRDFVCSVDPDPFGIFIEIWIDTILLKNNKKIVLKHKKVRFNEAYVKTIQTEYIGIY